MSDEIIRQECGEAAYKVWKAVLADVNGSAWQAGKAALTERTGLPWEMVNRHLARLESAGYLDRYGLVRDGGGMKSTTHLIVVFRPGSRTTKSEEASNERR